MFNQDVCRIGCSNFDGRWALAALLTRLTLSFVVLWAQPGQSVATSVREHRLEDLAGAPAVTPNHPRLLLTPAIKTRLLAKVAANDPDWIALRDRADLLTTYAIFPYKYETRTSEPPNTIFSDYQGEGWWYATMPLALACQMTGDPKYCAKLSQLADEMWRAQFDPENNQPNLTLPPLQPDNYYPTRSLGPALGIIFDWCYERLGITRTNQITTLMNLYFDDLRANAYQRNENADGNYYGGHLVAAAYLGDASFGDNPWAQQMIDYARICFDGTPSARLDPTDLPDSTIAQVFDGGYKPYVAQGFNGPDVRGAPFKMRSDLSTAYNNGSDPAVQVDRKLDHFYRSFVYLRSSDLFVVYDQISTVTATNPLTPYLRHLRWHFPTAPTVTGRTISLQQGASRLYLDTLLPTNATFAVVDESNNPDAGLVSCQFLECDTNTFRVEVRDPANQRAITFLSVIQVGPPSRLPMSSTNLLSIDGRMRGAMIVPSTGAPRVVLFNDQSGQVPAPITSTSYRYTGSPSAVHTLGGLVPEARYRATLAESIVSVALDSTGSLRASAAGVLQFTLGPAQPAFPAFIPQAVR